MVTLQDSLISSTSRRLPFRVRADIEAISSRYLGRLYWIVKDPMGLRYFRFHEEEYALLQMVDGTRSLDDIRDEFESRFAPQRITVGEIQRFLGQLHRSGLIVSGLPGQGVELLTMAGKKKRAKLWQQCSNVLAIRFPGIDPDRLLTRLLPWVQWFFHPVTQFAALVLCVSAAALVLVQFDLFQSKLPAFQQFFSPGNLVLLSAVLGLTKVLHEFGHGFTAKYFGGECHQMGFMLLVLTPCLYVDASDSWMLPNKWHRMAIVAAGVWVECVLAAICTFIWWFSTPGLLHYLCLNVMFLSSVSTIVFNINPLLRYDGYYLMADWLEIPNLRQKSQKILTQTSAWFFLGIEPPEDPFLPDRRKWLFAVYAVAAFVYRWMVTASILFFLYHVFKPWGLQIIGQAIAAMSIVSLVVMPLVKVYKFFARPGRSHQVKRVRLWGSLSFLALLVALFIWLPLPATVVVPAVVALDSRVAHTVFVPQLPGGCLLKSLNIEHGDTVKEGAVLGQLDNLELEQELRELLGKCEEFRIQLENAERLSLEQKTGVGAAAIAAASLGVLRESLASAESLYREKWAAYNSLTLRSPCDGMVVSPPSRPRNDTPQDDTLPRWSGSLLDRHNLGATLEPGTVVCEVGDPAQLVAVAIVDQSRIDMLLPGQAAEIRWESFPRRRFRSAIREIEKRQTDVVPPQLSTRGGGDVPTTTTPEGQERPQGAAFRVEFPISTETGDAAHILSVGMTGLVKINVAPQTLAQRLTRLLAETFHFRL